MPGKNEVRALLFTLALGLLPACGGTETSDGVDAASGQASAATCSGYVGLTFDDGPTSNTSTLLGILKANGVQATLFNIGQNVAANPSLVKAEADAGMWVQNHSYTHQHMTSWSQSQVQSELTRTSQAIAAAGGGTPKIFRPPYGEVNSTIQAAASAAGLRVVTWDVDSQDWNGASTASIVAAAGQLQNGQIILMHDGYSTTNAAIPQIMANLASRGLCPGMIDPSTGRAVAPGGTTTYTLAVTKSGTGSGTVTSNTGGINCGSTCSASYAPGTSVSLTVTPASGSTFTGWSGACSGTGGCNVAMNSNQSVTASFSGGTTYALTVTKAGTGSGTVTSSPAGVSCGSACTAGYAPGTSVSLTATPASGSTFTGWSGACSGAAATCTVSMTAAQSVTATFTGGGTGPCANPVTLTSGNSGNFNTTGAACYRTSATINGWGCYNMDGRTISVNGTTTTCGSTPVAKWTDGYAYFAFSAGTYPWAGFYYW